VDFDHLEAKRPIFYTRTKFISRNEICPEHEIHNGGRWRLISICADPLCAKPPNDVSTTDHCV